MMKSIDEIEEPERRSNGNTGDHTSSRSSSTASSSFSAGEGGIKKRGKPPRTKSSDRLFKGMLLICAFGFIFLWFSVQSTTTIINYDVVNSINRDGSAGDSSSSTSMRLVHSAHQHQQIELLRDFKKGMRNAIGQEQQVVSNDPLNTRQDEIIEKPEQEPPKTKNDPVANVKSTTTSRQHPPYHVVFSTSCNEQQHWESYVFFYHANKVGQDGNVTRILSGCNEKESQEIQQFHDKYIQPMNPNFHLHLTPNFADLTRKQRIGESKVYKYMNKPYGLKHWMENALKMNDADAAKSVEDGIVMLLDPDMILLRPLVHDYTNEQVQWILENGKDEPPTKVVKHGYPIAQQDGYLGNQWMYLNATFITRGGNIDNIPSKDGPIKWNTGPPYLATVKDMYAIASLWCDFAPRVYHVHSKLFAEMYGYIYATTQLNLPHTLIKSIVVSETETKEREGWSYIDDLPEEYVCDPPSTSVLPIGLHYCKRYMLEKYFFSKYRLKKKYITCESPLLQLPPSDLATRNYTQAYSPPPHGHPVNDKPWTPEILQFKPSRAKREAYMLCALIGKINEAARYWKERHCEEGTANFNYYNLFDDPNH